MSWKDRKASYDSSDTETESKQSAKVKLNEKSFKLKLGSSDEEDKTPRPKEDGRRSRTSKKSSNSKLTNSDDEELTQRNSRTPSSERYSSKKSPPIKVSAQGKINHFSRPKSSQKNSQSSDDDSGSFNTPKNKSTNRSSSRSTSPSFSETNSKKSKNNKSKKTYSDDSDSFSNKSKDKKKDSFDRPKSSKQEKKKKSILGTSSSSSSSRSRSRTSDHSTDRSRRRRNSLDDDEEEHSSLSSSTPLKINIERKPPIDKSKKKSNRSPSLEKPGYDSDTSSKNSRRSKAKTNESDSQEDESSNEMTDVSPLPSPKRSNKKNKGTRKEEKDLDRIDTALFYNALNNNDFNSKVGNVLKTLNGKISSTRSNSANFNNTFVKQTTNLNDLNTCIDFTQTSYGDKLLRLDAENRRLYNKLLKATEEEKKKPIDRPIRLTSSALNRQKEQQRIEKENQLILKRLLDVKSSKFLRREDQLKDYEKNFGYQSLNTSKLSNASTSNLSTKRSAKPSANNSRVSSAKSMTRSQFSLANLDPAELLKRTSSLSRQRPEWNDRW